MTDRLPSARRHVALCADDFGLTAGANAAILELAANGAITATSVAVDGPLASSDAQALHSLRNRISIGLHLNLTENPFFPQARGVKHWILATWLGRIDRKQMAQEIHRQLERFETLFQCAPTHVDGHEHVHQFPGVREPLLDAIAQRYGQSTAIRSTWPRAFRGSKAAVIGLLGARRLRRESARRGLLSNTDFAGVYDLEATTGFRARMEDWLRTIQNGGLIMCHPESSGQPGSPARRHEYDFLRSKEWPAVLEHWNVELTRPDRLTAAAD